MVMTARYKTVDRQTILDVSGDVSALQLVRLVPRRHLVGIINHPDETFEVIDAGAKHVSTKLPKWFFVSILKLLEHAAEILSVATTAYL